jgi:hypothetical protein
MANANLIYLFRFEVDSKYGAFYTGGQVQVISHNTLLMQAYWYISLTIFSLYIRGVAFV